MAGRGGGSFAKAVPDVCEKADKTAAAVIQNLRIVAILFILARHVNKVSMTETRRVCSVKRMIVYDFSLV